MINEILKQETGDLKRGYVLNKSLGRYECLICGAFFEEGEIFSFQGRMFDASRGIKAHILEDHGGVVKAYLEADKKDTGLTEKQRQLLEDMATGMSDKAIAQKNGLAPATVRHQKFTMREKAKQAKMFLAIYDKVEEASSKACKDKLIPPHVGAKMVDARYIMTLEEEEKVLANYFETGQPLKLKLLPSKEKKKIAVLRRITQVFDPSKTYTELALNDLLKTIHGDVATLRRYLIQYGFLDRTKNGLEYWVKQ